MTAPLRTCRTACGCACMAPGPGGVEPHLRAGACYTEPCSCAGNLGVQLRLVLVCSRNNFAGMMKSATSPSRQNHPLRLQPLGPIARHAIVPALCGERPQPATGKWGRAGGRCCLAANRSVVHQDPGLYRSLALAARHPPSLHDPHPPARTAPHPPGLHRRAPAWHPQHRSGLGPAPAAAGAPPPALHCRWPATSSLRVPTGIHR